jgi:DNA-binding beta-propeller fold protein YncE
MFFKRGAMRRFRRMTVICLGLGIGLGYALSCSSPTKPTEPKGLRLYASEAVTKNLYVFDAKSGELLDSIPNGQTINMLLSADGQYLYSDHYDDDWNATTRKTATKSLALVGEVSGGGQLVFLDQGSLILRPHSDNVEYFDAATLALVGIDSVGMRMGTVASADTVGFVIGVGENERLIAYDFRNKQILAADSIILPDNAFARGMQFALHPTGERGFGIFRDSFQRVWFIGFKTPSLELEIFHQLVFPFGDIAVSPDGRYVLFDDPGDVPHGYPVKMFFVFDNVEQKMARIIDTDTLSLFGGLPWPSVSTIDFSPDGTEAYVSTGGNGWATGPVIVFDMGKLEFVRKIDMPFEWMPDPIVVGHEP